MSTAKKKYNLNTARYAKQREQMVELEKRGVCAFCREDMENEMREPIELETEHWVVKKNDYPYERTKLHLLVIPKKHVKTLSELGGPARKDFLDTVEKVEKKWKLTSYSIGIRSGDMRYNGGSVEHLHAHIVVGDTDDPEHEPVRFKMSARPKD
jgi:diadenosine tetraphosphate (Ap4A) HIT family hydrolase